MKLITAKTTATPPAPVGSSSGTELNGFVESTSRIGKGEDAPAASRPAIVITAMRGESEESNGESVTVTTATAATTTHQQKVVASNSTNCLTFLFYRRSWQAPSKDVHLRETTMMITRQEGDVPHGPQLLCTECHMTLAMTMMRSMREVDSTVADYEWLEAANHAQGHPHLGEWEKPSQVNYSSYC